MTLQTAAKLLKLMAVLTALLGLLFVCAPHTGLKPLVELFLDVAFWPIDGLQTSAEETTQLSLAISGGLLVGLGVVIWSITQEVFIHNPDLARRLILPALFAWYGPDSLGSWLSGAWFNVAMNTGFLVLFLLPLLLSRSARATSTTQG